MGIPTKKIKAPVWNKSYNKRGDRIRLELLRTEALQRI
jgi:hypothetical protein